MWLRNAGYFWVALGLLAAALRLQETGRPILSIWLVLGIGCLLAYRWRRISYSIFDAPKGRLLVIRDAKHDEIVAEIVARRRACYRSRYAEVDPATSRETEERRFAWLHEHELISDEEYAAAMKQICIGLPDHDDL